MSANLGKMRSDMHRQLNHLLSRAARLRSRLETARKSGGHTPLQLLRVRNVLLRIERRIVQVISQHPARLQPALATTRSRTHI